MIGRNAFGAAALLTVAAIVSAAPARAEDPRQNWTGFYIGGHLGGLTGTTLFSDPDGQPLYGNSVTASGFLGGLQAGYNRQLGGRWVLGVEADTSWISAFGSNTCLQYSVTNTGSNCKVTPEQIATFTGRVGFLTEAQGRTLLYGKAGVAWMRANVSMNPNVAPQPDRFFTGRGINFSDTPNQAEPTSTEISTWGPTIGAGLEYALSRSWSMKVEYNYLHFGGMSLVTPDVTDVTTAGGVTNVGPNGTSQFTQSLHVAKLGLNYRFGGREHASDDAVWGPSKAAAAGTAANGEPAWAPGWEIDAGARFWYSSGRYQTSNGPTPNMLLSRLSYNGVTGQSGELFLRVDTPFDVFVKGFVGGGGLSRGKMYDEDWGLNGELAEVPTGYEVTDSDVNGTLHYLTGDFGYNVMRGRDHKVGMFVGYNRYETTMNAMGCAQLVAPSSGVCDQPSSLSSNGISQLDVWQSVRLGIAAEALVWDRLKLGADVAWLPYVRYDGLDIHRSRSVYFPVGGAGQGVQAELIASWLVTDQFTIGVGGRYWSMWTTGAVQATDLANSFIIETDRYGVFLQAAYKFKAAR